MAGKTGTAQVDYAKGKHTDAMYYASSFAGYFPADNPKYSCIVIIHKPSKSKGFYGGDVSGPVFKRIAQKIFTDVPSTNEIKNLNRKTKIQEDNFGKYANLVEANKVPDVHGMAGMDAVALFENLKMKVKVIGVGKVKKQSIQAGQPIIKNNTITLELS